MSNQFYTRYVPPKPQKPSKASSAVDSPAIAEQSRNEAKSAEKKTKKRKRNNEEAQAELEINAGSEKLAEALNGNDNITQNETGHSEKRKKKRSRDDEGSQAQLEVNVGSSILAEAPGGDENTVHDDAKSVEKMKKRKRKSEEAQAELEVIVGSDIHAEAPGGDENVAGGIQQAAQQEEEKPSTKKPKRKKEKRKSGEAEGQEEEAEVPVEEEEEEEEEENKKHKAIFAKFEKSSKHAEKLREAVKNDSQEEEKDDAPEPELHDLVPLPQPAPVPDNKELPTFSALPSWLAKPISVPSSETIPFEELKIHSKLVQRLGEKGYHSAFAIQAAVLPLLLPGQKHYFGDICVSAATGSGKTLAYVLPMVQSMRRSAHYTRLRAVIVVPTRELVSQVKEVAELCASGTGLKIGTAVGSHTVAAEQEQLVKKGQRYDRSAAAELEARATRRVVRGEDEDDALLDDAMAPWILPYHVPAYTSKVDILICTPGRLVEHINATQGFNLDDLEWLVIDEADRLLDESFQEWVDVVIGTLEAEKPIDKKSAKNRILDSFWEPREPRYVRKIILSATMTRDLQKLGGLKLRRPVLVSVAGDAEGREEENAAAGAENASEAFELPSTLKEWAVPVEEAADKPLVLLRLLEERISRTALITGLSGSTQSKKGIAGENESTSDLSTSDSESDSDSDSSSDSDSDSDSDSEPKKASESNGFSSHEINEDAEDASLTSPSTVRDGNSTTQPDQAPSTPPTILIFTSANENATRLSHLLIHLAPSLSKAVSTLTKSSTSSAGRKVLSAFRSARATSTQPRILIATDRAARGLDLPELAHVVNYDMPHSVTSYVHRVGRTARAGRKGEAWTLIEGREAWWFWNKVVRGGEVRRAEEVERARVDVVGKGEDEAELRARYEMALEELKHAVEKEGARGKKKRDLKAKDRVKK
ncbi:P-loop containing nucleoside triphosphate hydrolase protein [Rhizodiscina lignyota]|uniref:ATP-dependent RNA helicase n=1 Tax=Rhizodiscina lignyota TaxID=1504668 RepID=A0A9P4ILP6_9PEZI|nr:P-loop containing nucleoside triphosphate hydrolase protein [Rhizodiscina lignyota]